MKDNETFLLNGLTDPEFTLREPIEVALTHSATKGYVISDSRLNRYGYGCSLGDAIVSYEESLITYFKTLKENEKTLHPKAQDDLDFLTRVIVKRQKRL